MESTTATNPIATPSPRRKRWVTIVLALVVFTSGVAIGAAGMLGFIWRQVQITIHHPELIPQRLASRLGHRLKLTPDQEARVKEIIASHQGNIQRIRRDAQPRVEVELRGVHEEVAALLDPQQTHEWDLLFSDLMKTWVPAVPGSTSAPGPQ